MKSATEFDNRKVHLVLRRYHKWQQAAEDFPVLEHVLEGVRSLDMKGNTRRLGMQKLFRYLRDLEVVSVDTMKALTGLSAGYCSKLCMFVRVASRAFAPHLAHVELGKHDEFLLFDYDVDDCDAEFWSAYCPSPDIRPFRSVGTSMPA